jgi:CubicO group peptidase (beta-lactamase class C family)
MTASRRATLAGIAAAGLLLPGLAWADETAGPFAGTYEGTLQAGLVGLRLRLEVRPDLTATGTSIDQGNAQFLAESVRIEGDRITFAFPVINASYVATRNAAGGLDGQFTQAGRPLQLLMARVEAFRPVQIPPAAMSFEQLHALRLRIGTPGVAAGWRKGNKRATVIADGLRMARAAAAVLPSDKWHLGSVTKSMTALLAARAVEAGVLGWDSTVGSVLGGQMSGIHPDFAQVSLLHLLSHNSGLPPGAGEQTLAGYAPLPGAGIMAERIRYAQGVLSPAPASKPGAKMAYSNANYLVAGAMLETLLARPWESLLRDRVFRPLGLDSAGFGVPGNAGLNDQPCGHFISSGRREPHFQDIPAVLGPAGLTHMNIADLLAYLSAHRDAAPRLLRKASWQQLHTAHFAGSTYALGWFVLPGGALMHTGSNGFWSSLVLIDPRLNTVSAFAGNDIAPQAETQWLMNALNTAAKG